MAKIMSGLELLAFVVQLQSACRADAVIRSIRLIGENQVEAVVGGGTYCGVIKKNPCAETFILELQCCKKRSMTLVIPVEMTAEAARRQAFDALFNL